MRKLNQLAALAILGIFALTSCGGAKSKGISQANPQVTKPPITAPAPAVKISLKGKVIDYTNKAPVPGAKLITFDKQEVTTSDNGEFTLQVPQDKGFTFRVKSQGYQETLAGGRIKAATSGVEVKLAKLNSGIFPVTLNIGDKGAKLFKGPTVPKRINITQGKLHHISLPTIEGINHFEGVTSPLVLSYFDVKNTHTWQYAYVDAEGDVKSGKEWLNIGYAYFLLGSFTGTLNVLCGGGSKNPEAVPQMINNKRLALAGGYSGANQQWNMIGCPFDDQSANLAYCFVRKNQASYNLSEAYAQNITGPAVFYHYDSITSTWEEASYPNGSLQPYTGYYYLVLQDCNIDIADIAPDTEADQFLSNFAEKLKNYDIEGAISLVEIADQNTVREALSAQPQELVRQWGQELGNAYFSVTWAEGAKRRYLYQSTISKPKGEVWVILEKDNNGNWKIRCH